MKTLQCSSSGFECDAVIHADTNEEVLAQAAAHAQKVHGVSITPEMAQQLQTLIVEE